MSGEPQPADLPLPPAFPNDVFEDVKNRITKMRAPSAGLEHLGGSHTGVRYRLKASADYSEEFTQSLQKFGDAPSPVERYQQERSLFGFFVSSYSTLDCFSLFMYAAASQIKPADFLLRPKDIKNISCKTTPNKFAKAFPSAAITKEMSSVLANQTFEELDKCRNILAHRSVPTRTFYVGGSSMPDPPADWNIPTRPPLKLDIRLTPSRLEWLVGTLATLVAAADSFTRKNFP